MPLADPNGVIAELQAALNPYPGALRTSFIDNLWQASFLMDAARKGLPKRDSVYVLHCCTTALMLCAHAWHAAAGSWPTNEKGLVVEVARLGVDSHDFAPRADRAVRRGGQDEDLGALIAGVAAIVDDTRGALQVGRDA